MTNPYNSNSNAFRLFAYMLQEKVFSRADATEYAILTMGLKLRAAQAITTTLMSPRLESNRGDPRGNLSAMGHLYYLEKLPREMRDGRKEEQKYRIEWREPPLEPRTRMPYTVRNVPVYWGKKFICHCSSEQDEVKLKKVLTGLIKKIRSVEAEKELVVA